MLDGIHHVGAARPIGRPARPNAASETSPHYPGWRVVVVCFVTAVGLSTAIGQFIYAFGPGLLGVLRDAFGDYGVPLFVCVGLDAVAAGMVLLSVRPS
jgi:hypothetical protein